MNRVETTEWCAKVLEWACGVVQKLHWYAMSWQEMQLIALDHVVCVEERRDWCYLAFKRNEFHIGLGF